jgi:polyisoprenoid-binding protein YceI
MSTSTTATPSSDRTERAATKTTWTIDTSNTNDGITKKHMMIATVSGRYTQVGGSVTVDVGDPTTASIDIAIPIASITTGDEKRDAHLRSPDFFDAQTYPTMIFRGKRVEASSSDSYRVIGDLTIRGVTG